MKSSNLRSALQEVLEQGTLLLSDVTSEVYTRRVPAAFHSSIGEHYRHCLDHFQTLLESGGGFMNYDARQRDPRIERDRRFALERTTELLDLCRAIPDERFDETICVQCKVGYAGDESPTAQSTFGREVMYSIAHAVHHYALIGVMCALQEVPVPEGFGIAPSTVKYRKEQYPEPVAVAA